MTESKSKTSKPRKGFLVSLPEGFYETFMAPLAASGVNLSSLARDKFVEAYEELTASGSITVKKAAPKKPSQTIKPGRKKKTAPEAATAPAVKTAPTEATQAPSSEVSDTEPAKVSFTARVEEGCKVQYEDKMLLLADKCGKPLPEDLAAALVGRNMEIEGYVEADLLRATFLQPIMHNAAK